MDPNMVLDSILGPDVTMPLVGSAGYSVCSMALENPHMTPGVGPDPGHPRAPSGNRSLRHQCRLTVSGPQSENVSINAYNKGN